VQVELAKLATPILAIHLSKENTIFFTIKQFFFERVLLHIFQLR
jgi:hypothetical protein